MTVLRGLTASACALVFALVAAAAGAAWCVQTTYRDSAHRWAVTLPDGWALRPDSEVAEANAAAGGGGFSYVAKFAPADAVDDSAPYVLAQWTPGPLGKASWSEIERQLGAADLKKLVSESGSAASALAEQADFGRIVLDEKKRRMIVRISLDLPDGGKRLGVCVGHFGKDGMAQLNCYAMEKDFPARQAVFDAMTDSFRFDSGAEWSEPSFLSSLDWSSMVVRMIVFGIVGAFVAGIVAAWKAKKKDSAPRRTAAGRRPPPRRGP
jgi:hypothetical protein